VQAVAAKCHGKRTSGRDAKKNERFMGQVSCFVLPLFFPLSHARVYCDYRLDCDGSFTDSLFAPGRDYLLLYKPVIGLPVPLAIRPVIYFLFSSLVLGSFYQAIGATVLAVGHISISILEFRRIRGTRQC
jgi:hypothetical protein